VPRGCVQGIDSPLARLAAALAAYKLGGIQRLRGYLRALVKSGASIESVEAVARLTGLIARGVHPCKAAEVVVRALVSGDSESEVLAAVLDTAGMIDECRGVIAPRGSIRDAEVKDASLDKSL